MDFEKKAKEIIEGVQHPAINHSLYDLGLIKSYTIEKDNVQIIMALPALNIPIIGMLIQSIEQPLQAINAKVSFEKTVMTPEELQKFLAMEQSAWKGL